MGCGVFTNLRYILVCCAATRPDAERLGVSCMLGTQCLRSAVIECGDRWAR